MLARSVLRRAVKQAVLSNARSSKQSGSTIARYLSVSAVQRNESAPISTEPARAALEAHLGKNNSYCTISVVLNIPTLLVTGPRAAITHNVSSISSSALSNRVILGGWIISRRQANANLYFVDLRDSSGTIQLALNTKKLSDPKRAEEIVRSLIEAPLQSVVQVEGIVKSKIAAGKDKAQNVSFSNFARNANRNLYLPTNRLLSSLRSL
jgi:lysyl-tRNA synthetase class II